jgi:hypothetical protein
MTNWGYLLLAAFVALGLTERTTWRKASRLAVIVTALLMLAVFADYGALR